MPRRKKKGIELPPLEFVESPLYQYAPFRHFQFSESVNHAMARPVPVDELENIPWISPQFRNRQATHVSRSRKNIKSFTKLRSKSEGSSAEYLHSGTRSKFPPLQFFQHTPKSPNLKHAQITHEGLIPPETNSDTACVTDHRQLNSESVQDKSFTTNTPPNQIHRDNHACSPEAQGCKNVSVDDINITNNSERDNTLQASAFQPVPTTTTLLETERKAVTATSCDRNCVSCGLQTMNNACDSSDVSSPRCVQCQGEHDLHHSMPVDADTNFSVPNDWNLCTPPRHARLNHGKILVVDTPEHDYGLNMRQRQLKYLLRKDTENR